MEPKTLIDWLEQAWDERDALRAENAAMRDELERLSSAARALVEQSGYARREVCH